MTSDGLSKRSYLAERYWPGVTLEQLDGALERLRSAAAELEREGVSVRLLRSTLVPREEAIFCFFEAASAEGVRAAGERAEFPLERISEALPVGDGCDSGAASSD